MASSAFCHVRVDTPESVPAKYAFPPVSANRIAGAGQPLRVASELLQRFRGEQLRAVARRVAKLDVVGKIMVADAAHTQVATAKQILYGQGADYLLTVKENQKGLFPTL
jgi:hypothetical protein